MSDLIDRQALIKQIEIDSEGEPGYYGDTWKFMDTIKNLPFAEPEPLSDAYMKAVWTWLINYQIKVAELKGRYTPYEVLSWVVNDWRKEHEQSN